MKVVWLYQREQLQRLAMAEGLPVTGKRGPLREALAFGEMLTLAPDESAASRLIREDNQGALAFLDFLNDFEDAIKTAEERPSTSELDGPFHELADFATEFLNELKEIAPDKFE